MSSLEQQRGVALITALLVVAIATIAVVSLASRQNLDIRRTGNVIESDQAYLHALGVETVARELLSEYRAEFKYDKPEVVNTPYAKPVEGGMVSANLTDLEAKFNVNALVTGQGASVTVQKDRFRRLLKTVQDRLDERAVDPDELVNAVVDWIDPNEEATSPGGVEDSGYLSEKQPYRAANRRMASPTELLMVRGFSKTLLYGKKVDKETIPGLLKYVSALPDWGSTINVNSAEPEVLLALSPHLTEAMVKDLIKDRPYKQKADIPNSPVVQAVTGETERNALKKELGQGLDVQSHYFQANIRAQFGRADLALTSMISASDTGGKIFTISRSIGTDGL